MKETTTVQVYPDDAIVNRTIEEYGSFGWEVINNQRCQEFDGTDSSGTRHYSTFNKLTFTREKSEAWYEKVVEIEREYNTAKNTLKSYKNREPELTPLKLHGFVEVGLGIILFYFFIIPGVIYTIVRIAKKAKYKKQYEKELAEYKAVYPAKIRELEGKMAELRTHAERCISGKA